MAGFCEYLKATIESYNMMGDGTLLRRKLDFVARSNECTIRLTLLIQDQYK